MLESDPSKRLTSPVRSISLLLRCAALGEGARAELPSRLQRQDQDIMYLSGRYVTCFRALIGITVLHQVNGGVLQSLVGWAHKPKRGKEGDHISPARPKQSNLPPATEAKM